MAKERVQRRLAAILAADVVGYSRLMGADEAGTLAALRGIWSEQLNPAVAAHRGRIVKMLGDGVHFHFEDPAGALLGSLDFVDKARERELPPAHVGVNAGPMTYTDGDYYGMAVSSSGIAHVIWGEADGSSLYCCGDVWYSRGS